MTKDSPYTDEREFRLLLWELDPKNANQERSGKGVRVPVNVEMLVERVFINPLNAGIPGDLLALLEQHKIPVDTSDLRYK